MYSSIKYRHSDDSTAMEWKRSEKMGYGIAWNGEATHRHRTEPKSYGIDQFRFAREKRKRVTLCRGTAPNGRVWEKLRAEWNGVRKAQMCFVMAQ